MPSHTRVLSVTVTGSDGALFSLASLMTADGTEQVGVALEGLPRAMEDRYFGEELSLMPGSGFYQQIRLGTYVGNFPNRPGDVLSPGLTRIQVASNLPGGEVEVRIEMPEENGASLLHLNVFAYSDFHPDTLPPQLLPEVDAIFSQAGLRVVIDEFQVVRRSPFARLLDFNEPQEGPTSQGADLARDGAKRTRPGSRALNLFLVDTLAPGIAGISLGTPGAADPASYYFGVAVHPHGTIRDTARTIAHELSHYLGLSHVQNRGRSGRIYEDQLEDTQPFRGNLMDRGGGTTISAGQAWILSRHPLLTRE